jgi:hypothetical protein
MGWHRSEEMVTVTTKVTLSMATAINKLISAQAHEVSRSAVLRTLIAAGLQVQPTQLGFVTPVAKSKD